MTVVSYLNILHSGSGPFLLLLASVHLQQPQPFKSARVTLRLGQCLLLLPFILLSVALLSSLPLSVVALCSSSCLNIRVAAALHIKIHVSTNEHIVGVNRQCLWFRRHFLWWQCLFGQKLLLLLGMKRSPNCFRLWLLFRFSRYSGSKVMKSFAWKGKEEREVRRQTLVSTDNFVFASMLHKKKVISLGISLFQAIWGCTDYQLPIYTHTLDTLFAQLLSFSATVQLTLSISGSITKKKRHVWEFENG